MLRPLIFLVPFAALLAACATIGKGVSEENDLTLYGYAYGWGRVAFRCYPIDYRRTPEHARDERLRKSLRARLLRVRGRLVERLGEEAVYDKERESDLEEEGVYRTGCDLDENAHAQRQYRRFVKELEVRTDLRR